MAIMIKIIFFGSSKHSLTVLQKLIDKNYQIAALITKTDKIESTAVSDFAYKRGIPVIKTSSFTPAIIKAILNYRPDLLIAAYYGLKIPLEIIKKAKFGGLNIHPSLLPQYRGAAPAEWAILKGEKETGVTILTLARDFDCGKILIQSQEPILATDTSEDLYKRLFEKGADLLVKILPDFLRREVQLKIQDETKASFAPKLRREDGKIDWQKKLAEIERQIRAFYPWPGTFTFVKLAANQPLKRLKIIKAHLEKGELVFDQVQLEGKKPVSFKQFKEGYPNFRLIK